MAGLKSISDNITNAMEWLATQLKLQLTDAEVEVPVVVAYILESTIALPAIMIYLAGGEPSVKYATKVHDQAQIVVEVHYSRTNASTFSEIIPALRQIVVGTALLDHTLGGNLQYSGDPDTGRIRYEAATFILADGKTMNQGIRVVIPVLDEFDRLEVLSE